MIKLIEQLRNPVSTALDPQDAGAMRAAADTIDRLHKRNAFLEDRIVDTIEFAADALGTRGAKND